MARLSTGKVLSLAAGLFLTTLAFDRPNAEQLKPAPAQLNPGSCAKSDLSVRGLCPGISATTIEVAYRDNYPHRGRRQKARGSCPTFAKSTPYETARARLLQSGWQPGQPRNPDTCEKGDSRCEGKPEMQSCAGTGDANCQFLWQKAGTLIAVDTIADPPVIDVVECPFKLPPDPR